MKRYFTIIVLLALIFIQNISKAQETKSDTGIDYNFSDDLISSYI